MRFDIVNIEDDIDMYKNDSVIDNDHEIKVEFENLQKEKEGFCDEKIESATET